MSNLKIKICSDLHLEFQRSKDELYSPTYSGEDILVLAGDVQVGLQMNEWFKELLQRRDVIYILGNHEFYHHDFTELRNEFVAWAADVCKDTPYKLYAFENDTLIRTLDSGRKIKFIGASLWTDFDNNNPIAKMNIQNGLNDFRMVTNGSGKLVTADDVYKVHVESRKFIEDELAKDDADVKVVITHHAPSSQSSLEMYKGSAINPAFYSDLESVAENADYWIHGHMHNTSFYNINKCQVICNPYGYYNYETNQEYRELTIEV